MVGGNPQHDAYGFRYWNNPGAFNEWRSTGMTGQFEGFLAALFIAPFIIVGPEYLSMAAAEVKHPRIYLKNAYKTMYWRFALFFLGGALCVGIVTPYNNEIIQGIISGKLSGGTAAASPYVIAMKELGIGILPSVTNALIATSIFSAGNTYTYCGARSLYGLALEGRAPRFLTKCTANGVPIYALAVMMAFACLSFLQLSGGSAVVLNWLVNLITAGVIIDYQVICLTYLYFYRACKAQNLDRKTLPYYGWGQPYCAWAGLITMSLTVFFYGYTSFAPWNVSSFFTYYGLVIAAIATYSFWKIFKKTKVVSPLEADLIWNRPNIDAYEAAETEVPMGFWRGIAKIPVEALTKRRRGTETVDMHA